MSYAMLNPLGMNNLALDAQGSDPLYPVPGTTIEPKGLLTAYYRAAFDDFASRGPTLTFPYDWRMSARYAAQRLADKLASRLASEQFYLVGHSNGGMVARIADALLKDHPNRANLLRVVQVGTPNYGSWEAPRNLAGIPSWLAPYARQFTTGFASVVYGAALVYLEHLIAHWRSVYELMPDPVNGPFAPNPVSEQLYALEPWQGINSQVNQFQLNWGHYFHATLEPIPEPGKYFAVAGYGSQTTAGLVKVSQIAVPSGYYRTPDGDGVVTISSAVLRDTHAIYCRESHAQILDNSNVRAAIWNALPNGLADDVFI
jgi:pimeloyl-ACP methyl ester carboxylesterase